MCENRRKNFNASVQWQIRGGSIIKKSKLVHETLQQYMPGLIPVDLSRLAIPCDPLTFPKTRARVLGDAFQVPIGLRVKLLCCKMLQKTVYLFFKVGMYPRKYGAHWFLILSRIQCFV